MSKHTKVPWVRLYVTEIRPANNPDETLIAEVNGADRRFEEEDVNDECVANAEFIIRAVNCHDELVEALEWLGEAAEGRDPSDEGFGEWFEELRKVASAALAKATGEAVPQ